MTQRYNLKSLSDQDLEAALGRLVKGRRQVTTALVAHIAEFDARRLYAESACSSTFVYCQTRLHLSESATSKAIRTARLAREFPVVFDCLEAGDIHQSGLVVLAPHVTEENLQELLTAAKHKSKREIERLVAERFPRPDVPDQIRKLPVPKVVPRVSLNTLGVIGAQPSSPPLRLKPVAAPKVEPLAKARYKVAFTASQKLHDDIETAKALLGPRDPGLERMFEEAMARFVEDLKKKKYAETQTPRARRAKPESNSGPKDASRSRHVPNEVKREVATRDAYQCTFIDAEGNRCQERWGLELHHHDVPFARGGEHTVDNVRLMCKTHNRHLAEREFGARHIEDKIGRAGQDIPRGM